MSMTRLALQNLKTSARNYLSLVVSLAFTILIFFNFQCVVDSDAFDVLGEKNRQNMNICIQVITVVLICFMIFFIWYSTNVFLTRRKREIGIYVFMGLTNQKIGQLYMVETSLIGLSALGLGLGVGMLTGQLFQMVLVRLSDIAVEIRFHLSFGPVWRVAAMYLPIYLVFVVKGYVNIVRSSVLELVSASRKNEFVRQSTGFLAVKAVLGVGVLAAGYYLAIKDGGMEVMNNVLAAVVLVTAGVYLLFGGMIPLLVQGMAARKHFLYKKERTLWVNNIIFRMKRNYRTYAMVAVLMLCSVTALAMGFAMKNRYTEMAHFRSTWQYQVVGFRDGLDGELRGIIEEDNEIACSGEIPLLLFREDVVETRYTHAGYGALSRSAVRALAEEAGLEFTIPELGDDEVVDVTQLYLMSLITDRSDITVTIDGSIYRQVQETSVPYLGVLQEHISFYMVSDRTYEKMRPLGTEVYLYNYRITNPEGFAVSADKLKGLRDTKPDLYQGCTFADPTVSDMEWIKVLYSICTFMFMVFVLASGSILFMRLYNDAFEDRERYRGLYKIGVDRRVLGRAVAHELLFTYAGPFLIMTVSSWFSVHALGKVMHTDLLPVNIVSVLVILVFYTGCYFFSLPFYRRNAGIE